VNDVHDYLPIQLTDILLRLVTKADLIRRDARPARDCRCKPSSTGRSPHGIKLTACERTTSENYLSILPMMLAKRCCLVDNMTLRSQLAALERRVGAGDRETISHPQHASAHDDVACAACGALVLADTHKKSWIEAWGPALDDGDDPDGTRAWRALRLWQHIQRYG
jgi:hypothetical protein